MIDNQDLVSPLPPGSPYLPDGVTGTPNVGTQPVGEDWITELTDPTGPTYGLTVEQVRKVLAPKSGKGTLAPFGSGITTRPGVEGEQYWQQKDQNAVTVWQFESGQWVVLHNFGATATSGAGSPGNAVPTVSLVTSTANLTLGGSFTLTAQASDSDGTIARVEFREGETLLSSKAQAPYVLDVTPNSPGVKSYTATAIDNLGATRTSPPQTVSVLGVGNQLPSVSVAVSNSTVQAGQSFTISAVASDADGQVVKVEFFASGTLIGTSASAPYAMTYATGQVGNIEITAKATDNQGGSRTALGKYVTITAQPTTTNTPPTVSYSQSVNSIVAGQGMTLSATASDSDGTVAKVEFFQGSTKVGEALTAPYSVPFTPSAAGSFIMSAKATDNQGATAVTSGLTLTVTAAPVNNVTPAAPAFTGFDDTQAGGTVTLVPAAGIPLSDYRVALPGSSTFNAVSSATISVGNVAGPVRAYSVAATGRNQSPQGESQAFTVYTAAPSFNITLTSTNPANESVQLTADPGTEFSFNGPIVSGDPSQGTMLPSVGGVAIAQLDFNQVDSAGVTVLGRPCAFKYQGVTYLTTFQNTPQGTLTKID